MKCKKNRKCTLDGRHSGACQDKKGSLIPPNQPVTVLTMANGKFSKYHV